MDLLKNLFLTCVHESVNTPAALSAPVPEEIGLVPAQLHVGDKHSEGARETHYILLHDIICKT